MACGIPAVLTTRGGLWHEFEYGKDALFAEVTGPEDLGVTITKLLQYPTLKKRLASNGAQTVHGNYTWRKISQQLLEVVNKSQRSKIPA